jgi:hypothetical protein
MNERITQVTVTFRNPWRLEGMEGDLPGGSFVVETEEEAIPGVSFLAYRRTRTSMVLPLGSGHAGRQLVDVDPKDLEAAIALDGASAGPRSSTEG